MPESNSPTVVVLIVAYNGRELLSECLASIAAAQDGAHERRVVVVDNASQDDTVAWLTREYPDVDCVSTGGNLGFAGGNNFGWEYIQTHYPQTKYLYLLNQDTIVDSKWLKTAMEFLEQHPHVACAQSKLLLHPATDQFNSAGNVSHYLGFGFVTAFREREQGQYDEPRPIDYPSGAALLVRTDTLRELGLFEPLFFAYLEDTDLGWKIRLSGRDVYYVPDSVVYHKYTFKSDFRNYFYLERNRWWLLLVYYRVKTLLLLLPALLAMEVGQLAFAISKRRLWDKLRSYAYFLRPANLRYLLSRRRAMQRLRKISDRSFLQNFLGTFDFPELQGFLVRWIANPFFGSYWGLARRLLIW